MATDHEPGSVTATGVPLVLKAALRPMIASVLPQWDKRPYVETILAELGPEISESRAKELAADCGRVFGPHLLERAKRTVLRAIEGFARAKATSNTTYADLMQEAATKIQALANGWRWDRTDEHVQFFAIAFTGAKHHLIDVLRREHRHAERFNTLDDGVVQPVSDSDSPSQKIEKKDLAEHVLSRLSPEDADILAERFGLRGRDEATPEEIAARRRISKHAAVMRVSRALERARDIIVDSTAQSDHSGDNR